MSLEGQSLRIVWVVEIKLIMPLYLEQVREEKAVLEIFLDYNTFNQYSESDNGL